MRRLAWLTEDFAEWDTGTWVHYTEEPFVKIRPQARHQDPAGIYLFPEKFEAKGGWRLFPYKFLVTIAQVKNILDLSKLSDKDAADLYEKLVPEGSRELSRDDFLCVSRHPCPDRANTMWDHVRNYFVLGKGRRGGQSGVGAWNRALRDAGYDAVFDDTGAIHSLEVQLLVLDPTKVDVIERVDQRSTGFKEMGVVTQYVADLLKPYGKVTMDEPRRRKSGWSTASAITASVHVEKADDPSVYATWAISPVFSGGERTPAGKSTTPREIAVHLQYSSPSLGSGRGGSVELGKGDLYMGDMRRELKYTMNQVWEKAEAEKEPVALAASVEPPAGRKLLWLEAAR